MKKLFVITCSILGFTLPTQASNFPDTNENAIVEVATTATLDDFFTAANNFLVKYTTDGKVDYSGIKTEGTSIKELYETIGNTDLGNADKNTRTAFFLNAYNIIVIHSVVKNMPVAKPTDVKGFFDATKHNVAGSYLTLNDIENNKLRPDPRVHFSLVCAAKGCPKIASEAFMPSTVETQLTALTKKAMNDASFIKVDNTNKVVKISQIFDWYGADFIKSNGSALSFINSYRDSKIPDSYKVEYYTYDWNLNKL